MAAMHLAAYAPIYVAQMQVARHVRIRQCVVVVAVAHVIYLQTARLFAPLAQQNGAIVRPAGEKRRTDGTRLVFCNTKDGGIGIILLNVAIALHIVFVEPSSRQDICVTHGRNRPRLVVAPHISTTIGAAVMPGLGNTHQRGRAQLFDAIGRDTVDNDKDCLARFGL